MIKKRIVPEHEESYIVCDFCGDEINDYSHAIKRYENKEKKHFHSVYAGGKKGNVKKTRLDLYNEDQVKSYHEKQNQESKNKV